MPHLTALASFSSWEYLLSVSVNALERYVSGLHRLAKGSYCFMVAAIPPGLASVLSLILRCGSKYAITLSFDLFKWLLTVWCPLELNAILNQISQWSSHLGKSFHKICLSSREEQEGADLDCWLRGCCCFQSCHLVWVHEMPLLENTFPKNLTARILSPLFFKLSVSPCSRHNCSTCLSTSPCSSGAAPKTRMSSKMLMTFGSCTTTLRNSSLKISGALLTPKCSLLKRFSPLCV